ncbi:MAG TPA: TRAP transporter small permease subunit [Rhodocyclaceae bacterium]|nr:TRAP transporter small permease subunit [Rhodocyclaceae bacterium]
MKGLVRFSGWIDTLNEKVGSAMIWLVLLVTLISAGNAIVRKLFDISSNAMLEIQWYLFSAIFLLCAGYTLRKNAHVRIDVLTSHFSDRTRAWIDVIGTLLFLFPTTAVIMWLSWDVFVGAFHSGEMSSNAGGLILWPARLLVPVGFALLLLQGLSELIKRVAFLMGVIDKPVTGDQEISAEEALAENIRSIHGVKGIAE